MSFNFFVKALFCWWLTCGYLIYWISVNSFLKLVLGCVRKLSVSRIQIIHSYLLSLQVCGRSWLGCRLFNLTCRHWFIDWIQVSQTKLFHLIVYYINYRSERIRSHPRFGDLFLTVYSGVDKYRHKGHRGPLG